MPGIPKEFIEQMQAAAAKQAAKQAEDIYQIPSGEWFQGRGRSARPYTGLVPEAVLPETLPEGVRRAEDGSLVIGYGKATRPYTGKIPSKPQIYAEAGQEAGSPYISTYGGDFRDITSSFEAGFPALGFTSKKPYLSTSEFDLQGLSQSPITAPQAQNAAQAGKMQSTAMQDAMKAIQDATARSGKMEAMEGFKPEAGRRYSVEKDAAGNIIKVNALMTAREKALGGVAPGVLEGKSWKAEGSEGGAGHPFTPNLDKFKAQQTWQSQIPSWEKAGSPFAGKTAQEQAQMRSLVRESTGGRSSVGRVTGADVFSGSGKDVTQTRYTPSEITSNQSAVAQAAKQQNIQANPDMGGTPGRMTGEFEDPYAGAKMTPSMEKKWQAAENKMLDYYKKNPSSISSDFSNIPKKKTNPLPS